MINKAKQLSVKYLKSPNIINDAILEVKDHCNIIQDYFSRKSEIVEKESNKQIINFVYTCKEYEYTINHKDYDNMITKLSNIKKSNSEVYLVYLGIKATEDCIDNNGRSRQYECKEGIRDSYKVTTRSWYNEALNYEINDKPIITLPLRDTSGSYVTSIVKELTYNDIHIGVFGIDILFRNIIMKLQIKNHTFIITNLGEIVYNSQPNVRHILEKQYNISLLLGPELLETIIMKNEGTTRALYNNKNYLVIFDTILLNRYYMIKLVNDGA